MRPTLACTAVLFAACGVAPPPNAAERIESAEQRLIDARGFELDFTVEARGAMSADFRGRLSCEGGAISMTWDGQFGETPKRGTFERPESTPPAVREAFVIGLSRMGILHNLFRLANGAEPDHDDGTVRDWVRAEKPTQQAGTVSFGIVVDGRPSGNATLWFDEQGLPSRRQQTVDFGRNRTMRVAESYRVVRIDE